MSRGLLPGPEAPGTTRTTPGPGLGPSPGVSTASPRRRAAAAGSPSPRRRRRRARRKGHRISTTFAANFDGLRPNTPRRAAPHVRARGPRGRPRASRSPRTTARASDGARRRRSRARRPGLRRGLAAGRSRGGGFGVSGGGVDALLARAAQAAREAALSEGGGKRATVESALAARAAAAATGARGGARGSSRGAGGGRRRCSGAPVSRRGDSTSLPDPARDERGERGERGEKRGEGRRARLMETTQPAGGRPSLMMRFFLGETFSSGSDAFGRPTESERAASKRVTKGKKGKHEISGQPRASTGGGRSGPRARRAASRAGTGRRSGRAVARVSGARSRRPA